MSGAVIRGFDHVSLPMRRSPGDGQERVRARSDGNLIEFMGDGSGSADAG